MTSNLTSGGDWASTLAGRWTAPLNSTEFADGFLSSLTVTALSELGDRTFFIAAILAVKHFRHVVFLGQMLAQALMTIASVALGYAAHFVPRYVIHYLSIVLFILFGCKMLYDVRALLLCNSEESESSSDSHTAVQMDLENQESQRRNRRWYSSGFATAFTMTIFAEWGDRSQMATIILAATKNPYAVTLGTLIGHALCTLLAVFSGRAIAAYIPVRVLTLIGALIFFAFAIVALISGYDEPSDELVTLGSNLTTTTAATLLVILPTTT